MTIGSTGAYVFRCYMPERDDVEDAKNVRANCASDAAEEYARWVYSHREGYEYMTDHGVKVRVDASGGEGTDFVVTTELVPRFSVSLVEEE